MEQQKKKVGRPKKVLSHDEFFEKHSKKRDRYDILLPTKEAYLEMTDKEVNIYNYAYLMSITPFFYSGDSTDESESNKMLLSLCFSSINSAHHLNKLGGNDFEVFRKGFLEGLLNNIDSKSTSNVQIDDSFFMR
jgi:hypothetical protein